MNLHLRWGILATGGIAAAFARDLRLIGAPIAAVGSRTAAAATAFADQFEVPRAHASYEALADDPDVDVVYIATPNSLHAENALMALAASKHVLIESRSHSTPTRPLPSSREPRTATAS